MTRPTTEQLIADLRELYNRVFIVNGKEVPTLEAQVASRLEALERVAMAARKMKDQKWSSVEKDNMEFQCITTCFVLDELRDTLKQLEDAS